MFCKNNVLYFLAGAAAMHTVSHIAFAYAGLFPMTVWGINWTSQLNMIVIAISALVTLALLYFAQANRGACHYDEKERERELARERALKESREREMKR